MQRKTFTFVILKRSLRVVSFVRSMVITMVRRPHQIDLDDIYNKFWRQRTRVPGRCLHDRAQVQILSLKSAVLQGNPYTTNQLDQCRRLATYP